MDDETPWQEITGQPATQSLATRVYSPLPVWLDLSRPMDERQMAMRQALIPARPQIRANILGLLASRYPVSATTDAATLDLQSRLLSDDLDDLPEAVLREACREAGRSCRFMPLAADIMAFAKPMMDKLHDDAKHMRDMLEPTCAPKPPEPAYVDPRDCEAAIAEMMAKFAEADEREGKGNPKWWEGPSIPAQPDASDELKAFAQRMTA